MIVGDPPKRIVRFLRSSVADSYCLRIIGEPPSVGKAGVVLCRYQFGIAALGNNAFRMLFGRRFRFPVTMQSICLSFGCLLS